MSNFRFIENNVDVEAILQQVLDNPSDWDKVSEMANIGGDLNPYGFLPLTMAVIAKAGDEPKDTELLQRTPMYERYTEIRKFLIARNADDHARAAFFRLKPGRAVKQHVDEGSYYLTKDRYHLSLQGTYEYAVGDELTTIEAGTFFWFNNKIPHAARNVGDVDRITFVFDLPHSETNP